MIGALNPPRTLMPPLAHPKVADLAPSGPDLTVYD
jgi:hypothetical protein